MTPAIDARDDLEDEHLEPGSSAETLLGALVAGSYRLTRHIGSGGSSHVFEGEHLRLGKPFAVKLLRPELDANRRTAQRFRREARAIARLKSEHVVSVIDCGDLDDGTPYLVMELLEGEDLRSLLNREGSLPVRRAVPLIIEACRGLSEVHAAGLVHRDLKPENLFITKRSTGEDWCKVLDFGVAKMESSLSTAENTIVGTARYMAPEQLTDSAAVGPMTDVYALGAILYECVAGSPMVGGSTMQEVMYRIMNLEPKPLSKLAPSLPRPLAEVIGRCIRKAPAARPSSTKELAGLLEAAVALPAKRGAANDTVAEDEGFRRPLREGRGMRSALAAATLVAVVSTGFAAWYSRSSAASRGPAEPAAATGPTNLPATLRDKSATYVGTAPAVAPTAEIPTTSASARASDIATPPPRSKRPPVVSPSPPNATWAAPRAPAAHRFDSTNPYSE